MRRDLEQQNRFFIAAILLMFVWGAWGVSAQAQQQATTKVIPSLVPHFYLGGQLTETPIEDPFGMAGGVSGLIELQKKLVAAHEDDRVAGVAITAGPLMLGMAQRQELHALIASLVANGKRVFVHAGDLNLYDYAMYSAASDLYLMPESTLWLMGIHGESPYLVGLLDKLGIEAQILHIGDYKSAGEIFTREGPSDAAQENLDWILDSLFAQLVGQIAEAQDLSQTDVRHIIDNAPYMASDALRRDLIDGIAPRQAFASVITEALGGEVRIDNRYRKKTQPKLNLANPFAIFSALAQPPARQRNTQPAVGVVYVEGTILPGYAEPSPFGPTQGAYSGDICNALEQVAEDANIKALVLRVDSPGGSAFASEQILLSVMSVAETKPVIVSMGNYAASGGYYVSCRADKIFADPATLTASIGVVGGKLVFAETWDKLGVTWHANSRGERAGVFSINRPFSDDESEVMRDFMSSIYDTFLQHVIEGRRNKLTRNLDELSGGRVYTGQQALESGLIDELGGFEAALKAAAEAVELDDYAVRIVPEPVDFLTLMLEDLSGESRRSPTDLSAVASSLAGMARSNTNLAGLIQAVRPALASLPIGYRQALTQSFMQLGVLSEERVTLMPTSLYVFN